MPRHAIYYRATATALLMLFPFHMKTRHGAAATLPSHADACRYLRYAMRH